MMQLSEGRLLPNVKVFARVSPKQKVLFFHIASNNAIDCESVAIGTGCDDVQVPWLPHAHVRGWHQ